MCGQLTPLTRDFHRLLKNVQKLTDKQVQVLNYEDDISEFTLEIKPNDGYYKRGKFEFEVKLKNYPEHVPTVTCRTEIYHPNIHFEYNVEDNVCLSLFDDWTSNNDLEDCVQGLLFLLYNPNLDDPNNPYFDSEDFEQQERFADDVQKSLEGEEIEGVQYERNIVDEEIYDKVPEENRNSEDEKSVEKDKSITPTDVDQNIPELKDENANTKEVKDLNCSLNEKDEACEKITDKTLIIEEVKETG